MTDRPDTQVASLAALESSGQRDRLTEYVLQLFKKRGPLADFQLYDAGAENVYDRPTLLARRNELTAAGILGYTDRKLIGHSGKAGKVWGIIGEHEGARLYRPEDKLFVRAENQHTSLKFPYGELRARTDEELGRLVRELLEGAAA